jgi:ABC-type transport system involved in multi-copper enzyme maturation permease subunit
MKYLAILKDSVREAIDTKVFYVMVALSGVLVLLVASTSFEPTGPEAMMANMLQQLHPPPVFGGPRVVGPGDDAVYYTVKKVAAVDQATDGPQARYRVTITGALPGRPAPEHQPADRANPERDRQTWREQQVRKQEDLLRERFAVFGRRRALEVTEVRLVPPAEGAASNEVAFELMTRPTELTAQFWPHQPALLFGLVPLTGIKAPLGLEVYFIEDLLVNGMGGWVAILISVIITAFFIPNMLRRGTIDLLLVKPLHRTTLLVYKYIGGLAFIFLNTTLAVGGVWLVLGLRSGLWAPSFLLLIPVITFFFAILYAVSALFGVLTRSAIVAILLTCGVWFLLYLIGQAYVFFQLWPQMEQASGVPAEQRMSEGWWVSAVNGVHFVLPRTTDLSVLTTKILRADLINPEQLGGDPSQSLDVSWGESLTVSLAFIAVMLGLASWRFATRDY